MLNQSNLVKTKAAGIFLHQGLQYEIMTNLLEAEWVRNTRNEEKVLNNLFNQTIITAEEQRLWFENNYLKQANFSLYLVYNKHVPIGYVKYNPIGYVQYKISDKGCEWGFVVHPDHSNMGFGSKMSKFAIDFSMYYLFSEFKIKRFFLNVLESNQPAIHVYERTGWTFEKINYNEIKVGDNLLNTVTYFIDLSQPIEMASKPFQFTPDTNIF